MRFVFCDGTLVKRSLVGLFAVRCTRGSNRVPEQNLSLCMNQGTVEVFSTKELARISLDAWRYDATMQSHIRGAKYKIVRFIPRRGVQAVVNEALRLQLVDLRKAFGPFCGPDSLAFKLLKEAEDRIPKVAP